MADAMPVGVPHVRMVCHITARMLFCTPLVNLLMQQSTLILSTVEANLGHQTVVLSHCYMRHDMVY